MSADVFTGFQLKFRAAIRAAGAVVFGIGDVQKDFRVRIPYFHFGQRARAMHAAFAVEVFGEEFDGFGGHSD